MKFIRRNENIVAGILIIGNIILLNLLVQNLFFRIDLTDDNVYTLADVSKNAVRNLDDQLVVKAYFSEDLPYPYNTYSQFFQDKLDEYKSYSHGKLTYEFIDPTDNPDLESQAQRYGIPPVQVNAIEKDKLEVKKVFMGAVFLYEDKKEALPIIQSTEGLEYDVTAMIQQLTSEDKKTVSFLMGNGEPTLAVELATIRKALGKRYNAQSLEISEGTGISTQVDALMVIRPTEALSEWEKYAIDQYIMNGGKVAFLLDKVDANLQQQQAQAMNLEMDDWLSHYGFKVNDNLVYDAQSGRINVSEQRGFMQIQRMVQYPFFPIINNFSEENMMVKDLEGVFLPFVSTVDTSLADDKGLNLEVLATTSENAGTQKYYYNINVQQEFTKEKFSESNLPLAAVVSGKFKSYFADHEEVPNPYEEGTPEASSFSDTHKDDEILKECAEENRIVVFGDGEFMQNSYAREGSPNEALFLNLVDWLAQGEGLIAIRSRGVSTRPIEEVGDKMRTAVKWLNILVMPVLVIVAGFVYKKVRKKRKERELEKL